MPAQLRRINCVREAQRESATAAAWRARIEGRTISEIAGELNVSVGTVSGYLRETLNELRASSAGNADVWRALQLDRLDAIVSVWLPISRDPLHAEAVRAAAVVIRAVESQARLLGLVNLQLVEPPPDKPAVSFEEQLAQSPALRNALEKQLLRAKALGAKQLPCASPAAQIIKVEVTE